MTREEAIKELKEYVDGLDLEYATPFDKAILYAIQALSQEPCTNAISREKAKQFLYERLDRLNDDELYDIFSRIIDDMYNELPSVTQIK